MCNGKQDQLYQIKVFYGDTLSCNRSHLLSNEIINQSDLTFYPLLPNTYYNNDPSQKL